MAETPRRGTVAPSRAAPLDVPVAPRNPGMPLELDWVEEVRVNRSAVERRAATLRTRRTVKKEWQAAWLLRAITLMDLTTLSGDDTRGRVRRLCAKARQPVRADLLEAMGASQLPIRVAAVCVYHRFVPTAVEALDVVITREHALTENWRALYDEIRAMREACGDAHIKTILATGELGTLRTVVRASLVCMMAGADFVKTSTGKEGVNATLPVGLVMARAIREYRERTGQLIGLKPAGGIRAAKDALEWLALMKEELGDRWLRPDLFRFGASALLTDIERQLEHFVTGAYSAGYRHPAG
jgi:deoxyribose-phosphate aldolase